MSNNTLSSTSGKRVHFGIRSYRLDSSNYKMDDEYVPLKVSVHSTPTYTQFLELDETNSNKKTCLCPCKSSWTKTNNRLRILAFPINLLTDVTLWILVFSSLNHPYFKAYFIYLVIYVYFGFFSIISLIRSNIEIAVWKPCKEFTISRIIGYFLATICVAVINQLVVFMLHIFAEMSSIFTTPTPQYCKKRKLL